MRTLVDTGPLVALLKKDEEHHQWVSETFRELPAEGMVTCEAVISEACFLLARWPLAVDGLLRRLVEGNLRLSPMDGESAAIHALIKKYRNVPASYADACLVRLSERHPDATVLTTDSDFEIYRRHGRQPIPLRAPFR
ncbi:MAG: type II toxin-antitoxin system VapC family toxin [Myxococcaceae bacterium]